jgi:hypothetical protein
MHNGRALPMWNLLHRLLNKRQIEHRPAPDPRRRSSRPAVTTQQTHRSIHLNLSIFNFHRWGQAKAPRPPRQPGRSLLDLRVLDWAFGKRQPAPPTADRVRAANRRRDAAAARTAARQTVPRQPAPTSRPANRADQAELRRLQRERAAHEAQQAAQAAARQAAAQPPTVMVDAAYRAQADKPVPVKEHTRDGHVVQAHHRDLPGEGNST